jgi:hypothetical protein
MHIQEYVNLKKYAHFINLDISQKYSKLDLVCKFFLKYSISSTPTWYEKEKKKKNLIQGSAGICKIWYPTTKSYVVWRQGVISLGTPQFPSLRTM